jgi:hypothetical protein
MRSAIALALALLATTTTAATARAETVPIAVAPFSGRCFDAAALAERVRARVESAVTVGAPPRGSHQEVRVADHAGSVIVQVTARDQHGDVVGSARHVVPADDCAAALEVAALIVARAALPLTAVEPRAHKPKPQKPEPTEAPPPEPTPATPPPPAPPPPKPQVIIIEKPVPTPAPAPIPPGAVLLRLRGPEKRWVGELSAALYCAFALDGNGADEPAGELAVGFRRGHFGAALRGDVEGDFTVAAAAGSGIGLDIRRAQLALAAHADVPIRVGSLRFVFGPTLPLWSVRPVGVAHPSTHVIVSAGLSARVLYHLDIGRFFVTAGVTFDAALWREELTLTGVGPIARTPLFEAGPILGFGVSL